MEWVLALLDFILHVDRHIASFTAQYGFWVYALLWGIVFVETGLVIMPFLPGDSLLFITGTLCGSGQLSIELSLTVLLFAAIAGDQVDYLVGHRVGDSVWTWNSRWLNRPALEKAQRFYEKHGPITIVLARFMPFLRTFAPFVAGMARMNRTRFTLYNLIGGLLWVLGLTLLGYLFGNLPWVQNNLSLIIWALILIPGLTILISTLRVNP